MSKSVCTPGSDHATSGGRAPTADPRSVHPGDADKVREAFANDVGVNRLGVGATRRDGDIHFTFPTVIVAGTMADGFIHRGSAP